MLHNNITVRAASGNCIVPLRTSAFSVVKLLFQLGLLVGGTLSQVTLDILKTYGSFKLNLKKWLTS